MPIPTRGRIIGQASIRVADRATAYRLIAAYGNRTAVMVLA